MKTDELSLIERVTAISLSAVVLFLLIVRATHAGALWRDEAATLHLSQLPTVSDVAANFQHEAFPLPFPLTVRSYTALFGSSDATLRWFGFVVGAAILLIAWFNSRTAGDRGPLLFLSLFGLNTTFLTWGPSLRGYGLGCAFLLLALGFAAAAVRDPTVGNAIAATIAAIFSLQFMLNAVPLIGALAGAAFIVFLIRRQFRQAMVVCLCAAICAISFLPYLKSYLSADWSVVLKYPVTFAFLCQKLRLALEGRGWLMGLLWYTAVPVFILGTVSRTWILRREKPSNGSDCLLFLVFAIALSVLAYYAFLQILSYATRAWYYLPLLCTVAGAVDLLGAILSSVTWARVARLIFAIIGLAYLPFQLWPSVTERMTNIDLVARKLEQAAGPSDLIVINPWHFASSFSRYYRGTTPWVTVPTMNEHRIHRYDLMKAKAAELDPLVDVREAIRQTLLAGDRVWIVGGALPPDEKMPRLGPAPNPQFGWAGYMNFWSMELGSFLNAHAGSGEVALAPAADVNENENVPLLVAEGWRD